MKTFKNPVIPGFYPDASVCRCGDDFYLVATSQEFFPGLPLFRSRNLVDWERIGHVFSDPEKIDIDTSEDGQGLCAPTIRCYDGIFYVTCTLVRRDGEGWFMGSFITTAASPAGPWSDPKFLVEGPVLDPSLFRDDDGRVYWHANEFFFPAALPAHRTIWAQEIDLAALELTGEKHVLLDAADWVATYGEAECASFDGPRIYRQNGWYYLVIAAGDTHWNHAVMAFRSKNVFGPYEACPHNPLLTHRNEDPAATPFACTGHIDITDTPSGNMWGTLLGTRPCAGQWNVLGREVMLAPVDWSGDWPVIGDGSGLLAEEYPMPLPDADALPPGNPVHERTFIRRPREQWWHDTETEGELRIDVRPPRLSELANPSFMGERVRHFHFAAGAEVAFSPGSSMEEAGLALYRSSTQYFRLVITTDNGERVLRLIQRLHTDSDDVAVAQTALPDGRIRLRISGDGSHYRFAWYAGSTDWNILDATHGMDCMAPSLTKSFTGMLVGMFAGGNGTASDTVAVFNGFYYTGE